MAQISFTSGILWAEKPSLSMFVAEMAKRYRRPKYSIQISFAFEAVYYTLLERKLFFVIFSSRHKGWIVCFMHTASVGRNFIPEIQGAVQCFLQSAGLTASVRRQL